MMFVSRGIIKLKYRLGHGTPVRTLYAAVVRLHVRACTCASPAQPGPPRLAFLATPLVRPPPTCHFGVVAPCQI